MTEQLPDDRAHVRHVAIAVALGVAGVILFGVGLWMALRPHEDGTKQAAIEPAEQTAPSQSPTTGAGSSAATLGAGGVKANAPTTGTAAVPGGQTVTTASGEQIVRAARIAFRLGATLYVANEDGSAAKPIYRSDDGPYALSPDAKTIALVQDRKLKLIDVASGDARTVGAAEEGMAPQWKGDSSAVLYRRLKKNASDQFDIWSAPRV
jgi:hypothetical protein